MLKLQKAWPESSAVETAPREMDVGAEALRLEQKQELKTQMALLGMLHLFEKAKRKPWAHRR